MDPLSNSIFQTTHEEVIFKIFTHLDRISLSVVSLVCQRFNRISNDNRLWVEELFQRKIIPIEGQAKFQLVASLTNYCSVLSENKYIERTPKKDENIFELVAEINSVEKPVLENIFRLSLRDLETLNQPVDIKEKDKNEHIMQTMLESGAIISSSNSISSISVLARALHKCCAPRTIAMIVEQVPVHVSAIDIAILEKYSDEVVLILISKVKKTESSKADPLNRALKDKRSESVIKKLAESLGVTKVHFLSALTADYSEDFVKFLEKCVKEAFTIEERSLEGALKSGSSEKMIEALINKLAPTAYQSNPRAASRLFKLASDSGYSNSILQMLLSKCNQLLETSLRHGFSNSNPDEIVPLLLERMEKIKSYQLVKALGRGLSETTIKLLLIKVDDVQSDTILLAKEKKYSKELIQMLSKKCSTPDPSCTLM